MDQETGPGGSGGGSEPGEPVPAEPVPGEPVPAEGTNLGAAVAFLTLGLRMAAALVICGGFGYLLDDWLGTSPVFVLLGVLLGLAAAIGQAVITVRRYL